MRVALINSVLDYGSTGKIMREQAEGMKKRGHEVLMIYGRHEAFDRKDTYAMHDKKASLLHVLMTRLLGRHGLHSTLATKKMIQEVKEFKPDLIQIHNLHGYYLNVPLFLDYLAEIPIPKVMTLHDAWLFSGSSAYFDYHGCRKWDKGCVVCNSTSDYPQVFGFPNQKRNFLWKKDKLSQLSNLHIVTPSHWLSQLSQTSFLGRFKHHTIHNGIDLSQFKFQKNNLREKYELKNKFIILGVASVWETRKGLDYMLALAAELRPDEQMILIGLDKKQIKQLPRNVLGISRTRNIEEMVSFYSSADVFVNPTLEDNFPTTNLESLACGIPVITFDTGGSPEAIDSETGIVCDEKSVKSLRKSLDEIREWDQENTANQCRKRAIKYYSKEMALSKYLDLYGEIV